MPQQTSVGHDLKGEVAMLRILVPIDGSRNSHFVVPHIIREYQKNHALEIHLLNIQPSFSWRISRSIGREARAQLHRDRAETALSKVRRALDGFKVPYALHVETGNKAKRITETARRLRCDHIVMVAARRNSLTRMLRDSTTNKVLELTPVPVEVITGDAVSRIERYGIPVGISTILGLTLFAAAD
jgi:nucleotide-binding universal stress UspA family protein